MTVTFARLVQVSSDKINKVMSD